MLWSLIGILHASLVQIDTEMAEKYAIQQQPAVCGKFAFGRDGAGCVSALMRLVSLTVDLLTLKLVRESHLGWRTFIPKLGTLGLWVLDGRTDGRTEKSNAYCPLHYGRGHNKNVHKVQISQIQDGRQAPSLTSVDGHISTKTSDFDESWYTTADLELNDISHVIKYEFFFEFKWRTAAMLKIAFGYNSAMRVPQKVFLYLGSASGAFSYRFRYTCYKLPHTVRLSCSHFYDSR